MFSNVLAREFDLTVPQCALIRFDDAFVRSLAEPETTRLQAVSDGLKFGSVEVGGAVIVDLQQHRSLFKNYEIGTIFAFDNLVWNLDRGGYRNKSNLLVNDNTLIAIDHEQTFPFANDPSATNGYVMPPLVRTDWHYPYARHLFYPLLRQLPPVDKAGIFDTFEYFLRTLSVDAADTVADDMMRENIDIGNYAVIRKHLLETKARAGEFCQLLTTLIA